MFQRKSNLNLTDAEVHKINMFNIEKIEKMNRKMNSLH